MAVENTSEGPDTTIEVPTRTAGDIITPTTFIAMLDILENLTDHTHIVYDDYSTACNCNCACACGRGSL